MKATIYHNPRCSKSRATLALLTERGMDVDVIRYLETPPSPDELARVLKLLGKSAPQIIRFKEPAARERELKPTDERDEREWLALIAANPSLLERPIVVIGGKAAIGRPPENVLAIL
jgi:arsenate reductase